MSKELADRFVEALRELEENRNVEALVGIHTEDCEVGNVSVPETFRGTKACANSGRVTVVPSER
jgi:hypothetical protein